MKLKNLLGSIWRKFPKWVRRWVVERIEDKFTVTVAAVIVDDQNRVLLLKHVFRPGTGWGIPGGFIKSLEQPDDGIKRELMEEVGLEITDLKLITVVTHSHVNQVIIRSLVSPLEI